MQVATNDFQLSPAVLAGAGVRDGATERLRHRLEAVADTEHRHAQVEQRRVELRRALGVHAGRTAGQHHRLRIAGLDLVDRRGVRNHLGEHPRLAHPASDQLGVLRTEIDDQTRDGAMRTPPAQSSGERLPSRRRTGRY